MKYLFLLFKYKGRVAVFFCLFVCFFVVFLTDNLKNLAIRVPHAIKCSMIKPFQDINISEMSEIIYIFIFFTRDLQSGKNLNAFFLRLIDN